MPLRERNRRKAEIRCARAGAGFLNCMVAKTMTDR